jgi:PAS domain-containing protein
MPTTMQILPTTVVDEFNRSPIMRALVAQLPVGIIIASPDGQLEHVNDVARALFEERRSAHAPPEPWLGADPEQGGTLEPIRWIIGRVLLTGELVCDEEVQFLDARDEWRTLSVCATPVRTSNGRIEHAVVTFADVTGRNQARAWEPLIRSLSRL